MEFLTLKRGKKQNKPFQLGFRTLRHLSVGFSLLQHLFPIAWPWVGRGVGEAVINSTKTQEDAMMVLIRDGERKMHVEKGGVIGQERQRGRKQPQGKTHFSPAHCTSTAMQPSQMNAMSDLTYHDIERIISLLRWKH